MTTTFYLRQVAREFRGASSRLVYFVACLAIGVAAVTTVASLSQSLDAGIRSEAREMIGADVFIDSLQKLPPEVEDALAKIEGMERANTREQTAVIAAATGPKAGRSVLSELKVVEGVFPFYGSLELDPPLPLSELLDAESVVVAPEILGRLGVSIGNSVNLGGASFRIAGVAHEEPGRITGFMYLGPRAFLSGAGFARTSLSDSATRVQYKTLLKLDDITQSDAVAESLREELATFRSIKIQSFTEGRPEIRRGIEQLGRYLGLIALLSLLLGGVGIAQAVRSWIGGRLDSIAILKCVGLRPREVLALYVGQALLLGLLGSLAGVAFSVLVLTIVPRFISEHIPAELIDPWQPMALLRGLMLGMTVALVFSVPPLIAVLRVSPARVFRRNAESLPGARWVSWATSAVLLFGVAFAAIVQADSPLLGLQFTGGIVATAAVLALAAWGLSRGVGRLPRDRGRVWLRYGLAALGRPGAATIASIVGLGLGVLVLFCTNQVQTHLNNQFADQLPERAPSIFLADVRPDQWDALAETLADAGATEVTMVPLVMARIVAVDGESMDDRFTGRTKRGDEDHQLERQTRRAQFLTYMDELPPDNTIIEGALWSDPEVAELSIEKWMARELDLELGSRVTFSVAGDDTELTVTSIREVEWEDFNINFQLIGEPSALEDAPQMRIASARLPDGTVQAVQDRVAQDFPNVTYLQVGAMLNRIVLQLERIGWGVQFLGFFILAAGLAVLTGTVGVESQRRGREVALLKTLGMTRAGVAGVFATEHALVGATSGMIGVIGGGVLSWLAVTRALEIEYVFRPEAFLIALLAATAAAVIAGTGASIGALRKRPIEVLRHED